MAKEQLERFESEIEKLKDDLEKISNELSEAADIDNVFWQVQAIIANNPAINHNDFFQEWIASTYVDSIAIRLRRLIDRSRGTVSIWHLLDKMKQYSKYFTRERHVDLHEPKLRFLAEKRFDDLAGKGKDHVSKVKIEDKKRELLVAFKEIDIYVNSQIAHYSKNQPKKNITFYEIRKMIVSFFEVFNWCLRLISLSVLDSPVPQQQSNWLKYFYIPWIKPGSKIPSYKHLDEYIKESEKT